MKTSLFLYLCGRQTTLTLTGSFSLFYFTPRYKLFFTPGLAGGCLWYYQRNFLTDAPNKVWVSDITYAKAGMDFLYLCVVIDLYSRKVVSYSISENIDTALIKQAFLDAFHVRESPSSLVFHSDQGTQYTSFEFCNLLKQHKITQSFSAPGSPHDNAVAESFFASIKKEDFRRNYYKTE